MFWESSSICDQQYASVLDTADLDKISLEELIDKVPNLVNDYDVGNEKLIVVLKRRDVLESLIKHVTETPPENLDESTRFKYANQSCVLFSSKSNQIETELIQQTDLLDRLIEFLKTDDELNPYRSIIEAKEIDPKKIIPTYKSHLIDIADNINSYLKEYEQSTNGLPEIFSQDNFVELYKEWINFSNNELVAMKNKIIDVEQSLRTQQDAEHDFRKFLFQEKVKPIEFESRYNMKAYMEYEWSMQKFVTQFDKAVEAKGINPEVPSISTVMDQSVDSMDKFKNDVLQLDFFSMRFDEERSIEDEEKQKEIEATRELTVQFSEAGDQMSNLTDRDNIFQPLASSSNISNELNIVMDDMMDQRLSTDSFSCTASEPKKEDDIDVDTCRPTTGESIGGDNLANESKCEMSEVVEMRIESEENVEDDDWANFEKERANK